MRMDCHGTFPLHSKVGIGPPEGFICPKPTLPRTGETQSPRPLDSLDWCTSSLNHPISFHSPSPPPQSPPPSPAHPAHAPRMLPLPQLHHTGFQAIPELFLIIKTTSSTLQCIVHIAEKLICQVNAECQLAHKPQKTIWSSCEDTLGNLGCSQPRAPKFPS